MEGKVVVAKVKCITKSIFETCVEIKLSAVCGNSEENKTWAKYTPAGAINLSITNPDAYNEFEVGKEYLVKFEQV